jgi:uncharacterized lipoprotein YddW (UPF0748 family)
MKWFKTVWIGLTAAVALSAIVLAFLYAVPVPAPQVRALWVPRFNYATADDVRRIIDNTAAAGFTDVFFQIRGNATAYYPSEVEPWAFELSSEDAADTGRDPGWNPLQLAIDTARPHGLRVHAYMNVLPGWKGDVPPPLEARQLWTEHPDWFMVDSLGQKMLPTTGWYAFLNPVLPEVREHIRKVVRELCAYDVAGIHLDYIRYPYDYHYVARQHYPDASEEELMRHSDFSYDPVSQAALYDRFGWEVSKKQVTQFRCESVTRILRDISYTMQAERPGDCLLSASVLGNPGEGRRYAYQDSGLWTRTGLLDWVVQMNYGTRSFNRCLKAMKKAVGRRRFKSSVVVGINAKNDASDIIMQLERVEASGCRGYAVFAYSFLFDENHAPTKKGRIFLEARP